MQVMEGLTQHVDWAFGIPMICYSPQPDSFLFVQMSQCLPVL